MKHLVVVVGGLAGSKSASMDQLRKAIEIKLKSTNKSKNFRVIAIAYKGFKAPKRFEIGMFSRQEPDDLSRLINIEIKREFEEMISYSDDPEAQKVYPSVSIVSYSAGSLLVQNAMIRSKETDQPSWADSVSSHIILSGITRGWQFTTATSPVVRFIGEGLRAFQVGLFSLDRLLIWKLYRGSPFVTATRIGYAKHFSEKQIRTIYFLGAKDEYITPGDCIEVVSSYKTLTESNSKPGRYIEVPGTTHAQILQKACQCTGDAINDDLNNMIVDSILDDALFDDKYKDYFSTSDDIDDYLDPFDRNVSHQPDNEAKHLVFILHGIRDQGFWAKRISREIKKQYRDKHPVGGHKLRTITPSYGFFSMWDFLLPGGRTKALHWFLDQYANAKIMYPETEVVDAIAHSNGTYLIAEAIRQCKEVKFRKVIFANSVVRRDFWSQEFESLSSQLKCFFNIIGRSDIVVGLLPGAMETIPMLNKFLNVGGAGAYGFFNLPFLPVIPTTQRNILHSIGIGMSSPRINSPKTDPRVGQRMIKGGHGAGIQESCWKPIAEYIAGTTDGPDDLNVIFNKYETLKSLHPLRAVSRGPIQSALLLALKVLIGIIIFPVLVFILFFPVWYPTMILMGLVPGPELLIGNLSLDKFPQLVRPATYLMLTILVWIFSKALRLL